RFRRQTRPFPRAGRRPATPSSPCGARFVSVRRFQRSDFREWIRMRRALWPHAALSECRKDWALFRRRPSRFVIFVSERRNGQLQGFLEASLRDTAENCDTSPVGYIEGWYVDPDARRR